MNPCYFSETELKCVMAEARGDTEPTMKTITRKVLYSKQKDQAKLAGVAKMRAGWTQETRVAGEAANKSKVFQAQLLSIRTSSRAGTQLTLDF